jgi:hypothetical protein
MKRMTTYRLAPDLPANLASQTLFAINYGPLATVALVLHSWNTSERMRGSGGFESTQRVLASGPVVESSESGARWLGIAYWQAVNQFTRGGVRARWTDDGGRLTLLGGASLLSFGAPELAFSGNAVSCRYTIQGGLLALRAGGSSHSRSVAPTAKWSSASPSRSIFRASRRGSARPGGRERSTRTDRARCTLPSVAATSSYSPRGQACEGHGL